MEGVDVSLCLSLLAFVALLGIEAPTLDGFGLFFSVRSGWGHGEVLRLRGE